MITEDFHPNRFHHELFYTRIGGNIKVLLSDSLVLNRSEDFMFMHLKMERTIIMMEAVDNRSLVT